MGEVVRLGQSLAAGEDRSRAQECVQMPGMVRGEMGALRDEGLGRSVMPAGRPRYEARAGGSLMSIAGTAMRSGGVTAWPEGLAPGQKPEASWVTARMEEAGRTLLALPGTGHSTRLRTSSLEIVRTAMAAYGTEVGRVRPSVPSAAQITRMDEAFGWLSLIPQDRYVLRRIVGARCLVSPVTDRHLYSWRRLGSLIGADHKAVQRWHAQGVALLVGALGG